MKKTILFLGLVLACVAGVKADNKVNKESVVTKEYRLSGFSGLKVDYAVNVHYTQGKDFSIKAEGTEKQIKRMKLEVQGGILVISDSEKDKKSSNEKHSVVLYITSPDMNSLENNGVLKFDAESVKTGDFKLKNTGVLNMEAEQLTCTEADFSLKGVSNVELKMNAKSLTLNNNGVTKGELTLKADQVDINSSGVDATEVDFKGKEAVVKKSGTGTISLKVDCQRLDASNSGVGKLVISGTADETSINNSGITKIDVSNLNKF